MSSVQHDSPLSSLWRCTVHGEEERMNVNNNYYNFGEGGLHLAGPCHNQSVQPVCVTFVSGVRDIIYRHNKGHQQQQQGDRRTASAPRTRTVDDVGGG